MCYVTLKRRYRKTKVYSFETYKYIRVEVRCKIKKLSINYNIGIYICIHIYILNNIMGITEYAASLNFPKYYPQSKNRRDNEYERMLIINL